MERFYSGLLGLPVLRRWPGDAGERSVWLDMGAGAFLALERTAAAPAADEHAGWHMVALRIARDERATWVSRLAAAGHPVYQRTPFTIYARDPEGNRVGLSHYPEPADADDHV
jgi:catechol-2,3-dioxygenase